MRLIRLLAAMAVLTFLAIGWAPANGPRGEPVEGGELDGVMKRVDEIRALIDGVNADLERLGVDQRYSLEVQPQDSGAMDDYLQELLERFRLMKEAQKDAPWSVPEDWQPYQYEGRTYYIIPAEVKSPGGK